MERNKSEELVRQRQDMLADLGPGATQLRSELMGEVIFLERRVDEIRRLAKQPDAAKRLEIYADRGVISSPDSKDLPIYAVRRSEIRVDLDKETESFIEFKFYARRPNGEEFWVGSAVIVIPHILLFDVSSRV